MAWEEQTGLNMRICMLGFGFVFECDLSIYVHIAGCVDDEAHLAYFAFLHVCALLGLVVVTVVGIRY